SGRKHGTLPCFPVIYWRRISQGLRETPSGIQNRPSLQHSSAWPRPVSQRRQAAPPAEKALKQVLLLPAAPVKARSPEQERNLAQEDRRERLQPPRKALPGASRRKARAWPEDLGQEQP